MDATNLHMQTLKANKVEVGEKIKICLFPTALQASEGGAFVEWSSRLLSPSSVGEEKHPEAEDSASGWSN